MTFSQFRHVLSTEIEFQIAPDGFGPFDSMFLFARGLASFDCIYSRACGIWNSTDSYGGAYRKVVRQPASLKQNVMNKAPYFGGLLPYQYLPGTLAPAREVLNPNRRYRNCNNPAGTFQNPFPLAVFCNLNQRSPLDGPLKPGLSQLIQVRGGTFARLDAREPADRGATDARRGRVRPAAQAAGQRRRDRQVLSIPQDSERRALIAEASQAEKAGDKQLAKELRKQAADVVGNTENNFDANIPELLATRPDPNRFAIFSTAVAPDLLSSQWGTNKIGTSLVSFLATIDTPINPQGYFSVSRSLNWYGQFEAGLADDMSFAQLAGAPQTQDADGLTVIAPELSVKKAIPFFVGPDGLRDTAGRSALRDEQPRGRERGLHARDADPGHHRGPLRPHPGLGRERAPGLHRDGADQRAHGQRSEHTSSSSCTASTTRASSS